MRIAAILFAALTLATPAWAQQVTFTVGPETFTAPLPEGYCVPQGADVARMKSVGAALSAADTPLALVSCGATPDPLDYLIVIVPTDPALQVRTRAEVLSDPAFANPGRASGRGPPAGMGHDDLCGYIGGTRTLGGVDFSIVGCLSVFGTRTAGVYLTTRGDSSGAAIPGLKARARAFVMSVRQVAN